MFEQLFRLAPVIVGACELFQKSINDSNKNIIQIYIETHKLEIENEFKKIRNTIKGQKIELSEEKMNKLFKEYDSPLFRSWLLYFGYDPSSNETQVLRDCLSKSKPHEKAELALNYMENTKNWKRGFCVLLWKHFLVERDLFNVPKLNQNNETTAGTNTTTTTSTNSPYTSNTTTASPIDITTTTANTNPPSSSDAGVEKGVNIDILDALKKPDGKILNAEIISRVGLNANKNKVDNTPAPDPQAGLTPLRNSLNRCQH